MTMSSIATTLILMLALSTVGLSIRHGLSGVFVLQNGAWHIDWELHHSNVVALLMQAGLLTGMISFGDLRPYETIVRAVCLFGAVVASTNIVFFYIALVVCKR